MYFNAKPVFAAFGVAEIPDALTTIVFGNNNSVGQERWVGSMKNLRVYDDARSEAEIRADMMGIVDLSDPDLKAFYGLDNRSAASSISGQAALTLGTGVSVGALRLLDNATVTTGASIAKVRFTSSGIVDGAQEKLSVGATQIALDSSAGSGTVSVGADTWSWTRSGSDLVFSLAAVTPAKAQALLNAINYVNTAATVTDGSRNFTISLLNSSDVVQDSQLLTVKVDLSAPVFGNAANTTTISLAENAAIDAPVFNAAASDSSGSVTYTLSGLDADRFSISSGGVVTFKTRPDFELPRDVNGDNVYLFNVTATDANGNSAHKSVSLTVTDVVNDTHGYQSPKGQSVIDLGAHGKLILPVEVNGKTFYYWDRSGDGTINNGGQTNRGLDVVEVPMQAEVNALFRFASDFTTQNTSASPSNTFRYATLNGVRVALPTFDGEDVSNGSINYTASQTRHADGSVMNPLYDDLLAVWDAYNGVRTEATNNPDSAALAMGWNSGSHYLTASPADNGQNLLLNLHNGNVYSTGLNSSAYYVALQVL